MNVDLTDGDRLFLINLLDSHVAVCAEQLKNDVALSGAAASILQGWVQHAESLIERLDPEGVIE